MKKLTLAILLSFGVINVHAAPYYIFNIKQNILMGKDNEVQVKNYYTNLGLFQGIKQGTILNVYRKLFRENPYDYKNSSRILRVKIGELVINHVDKNSSIANLHKLDTVDNQFVYDIDGFIIGDEVEVKVVVLDPDKFL